MKQMVMKNLISQRWEILSQQYDDLRVSLTQESNNDGYPSRISVKARTPLKIFKIYINPELILCSKLFWTKKRYIKYVDYHLEAALELVRELNKPGSFLLDEVIKYHLTHKDDKVEDLEAYAIKNSHIRHNIKHIIPYSPIKRELISSYSQSMLKKEG